MTFLTEIYTYIEGSAAVEGQIKYDLRRDGTEGGRDSRGRRRN